MEQIGTYYKRGSKSDFAAVDMLPGGKDIPRIIISKITFHEQITINGRKETEIFTATFAPNPWCNKDFVLNSTNKARIAKAHWNDIVEDGTACEGRIDLLKNIAVRLTKEEARDVQNGGTTFGLRVSRTPAASEQEMAKWLQEHGYTQQAQTTQKKAIQESQVQTIVDWAKKNGYGIEQIAEKYDFASDAVKQAIIDALDDLPK